MAASVRPRNTTGRRCRWHFTGDVMQSAKQRKSKTTTEFGDFQTPPGLALAATQILRDLGIRPRSILEPTCGRGAFLGAAANCFPDAESIIGIDINENHLRYADLVANGFANR